VTQLVIRQRKSAIGEREAAIRTLRTLGLRRNGQQVEREDSPTVRGLLRRVAHLVEFSEARTDAKSEKSGAE
jgi:large subunit ribosomal protein L30